MRILTGRGEDDSYEPMSYRKALAGIIMASLILFIFCSRAGMSPWVFVLFFALYFAMSLALTRIRAESGIPEHQFFFVRPQEAMITVLGTRPFFLGLVLGEYSVACGWALLGVIVGRSMYVVWY